MNKFSLIQWRWPSPITQTFFPYLVNLLNDLFSRTFCRVFLFTCLNLASTFHKFISFRMWFYYLGWSYTMFNVMFNVCTPFVNIKIYIIIIFFTTITITFFIILSLFSTKIGFNRFIISTCSGPFPFLCLLFLLNITTSHLLSASLPLLIFLLS